MGSEHETSAQSSQPSAGTPTSLNDFARTAGIPAVSVATSSSSANATPAVASSAKFDATSSRSCDDTRFDVGGSSGAAALAVPSEFASSCPDCDEEVTGFPDFSGTGSSSAGSACKVSLASRFTSGWPRHASNFLPSGSLVAASSPASGSSEPVCALTVCSDPEMLFTAKPSALPAPSSA